MRTSIAPTLSRSRSFHATAAASRRALFREGVRRAGAFATAAIVGASSLVVHAPVAHAAEPGEVSPKGKGIVGGALLGGEVVTIVEAIAGVKPTWAYLVGAGVGAIGGGIGGYFVEQGSTDGRVPVYMLAGGLGLLIPALVLSLNATRYMPSEDATEDRAPTNAPIADPGAAGGSAVGGGGASNTTPPSMTPPAGGAGTPSPQTPAPSPATTPATPTPPPAGGGGAPAIPLSLFQMQGGAMRVGVPVPEVRPMYSMSELKQYGMAQQTEVRMPLVRVTF
jgi:hypothetical protein